jgi:polyisoprenoid-binding protein YceI
MPGFRVRSGSFLIALVLSITMVGCAATQTTPSPTAPPMPTVRASQVDVTAVPTAEATLSVSPYPTSAPTNTPTPLATPTLAPSTPAPEASPSPVAEAAPLDDTVRLVVVPERSQARYRVREQLAGVSLPNDAVGSTNAITGTIVGKTDGSIVTSESKFVVDLRTLKSDRSQRDNFLRRNTLQTDQYPYAVFIPTSASGLPTTVPSSGEVSFSLGGELTIRDVTKEVTWEATCQVQGDEAACQAKTKFPFAYFNLEQPRVPVVLSVEDNIVLEVDVVLQRVGG